jgi:hypothetical protein
MSRSSELRIVDPVLTNLVRGYSNAEFIGLNVFPFAPVIKEAGKIPLFGKENFLMFNTERAMRAKSNLLPVEARSTVDYATVEYDAVYPIDYREAEEDEFNARKYGAFRAQSAVQLTAEKQAADLAFTAANYPSGNKVTLSGTAQWTGITAASVPITDVRAGITAVRNKIGKEPNTMILGYDAFRSLQDHPTIIERIKYSMKGIVTIELLKEIFGIKDIFIGKGLYSTDAGVMTNLWNDSCAILYIPGQQSSVERSVYEPSFGYTLRKKGNPIVDTYVEEGGKIEHIRSTDNFVTKIVGSDAGYLISDTNA